MKIPSEFFIDGIVAIPGDGFWFWNQDRVEITDLNGVEWPPFIFVYN